MHPYAIPYLTRIVSSLEYILADRSCIHRRVRSPLLSSVLSRLFLHVSIALATALHAPSTPCLSMRV